MSREQKPWPAFVASFMLNDMAGMCKKRGVSVSDCGVSSEELQLLLRMNFDGHIDRKTTRETLQHMMGAA